MKFIKTKKSKNWLLNLVIIFVACIIGVVFIELIWIYNNSIDKNANSRRYFMTSGSGGVFDSRKDLVIYKKNSDVTHQVWFKKKKFINEYKYTFKTNNVGLVQNNNIKKNIKSILFLGDSFTEGTGSKPWFDEFNRHRKKKNMQFINGGILGTGFLHWESLERYLISEGYNISSIFVIYISDDFYRKKWMFSDGILKCTEYYKNCVGWESYLGTPPQNEVNQFLLSIDDKKHYFYSSKFDFKEVLKIKLPATAQLYRQILRIYSKIQSRRVVSKLINKYNSQIIFIHLPSKDEIFENKDNGQIYNGYIEKLGGKTYSGYKLCGLNIGDFYEIDGHPNKYGYEKIRKCISAIVDKEIM